MRVAILKVDADEFDIQENFNHSLGSLQEVVGGYIEAITIDEDEEGRRLTVWLNEEGKLNGMPPNFGVTVKDELVDIVMGDVIITSTDIEGETVGLNDSELEVVKKKFNFNKGVIIGDMFVDKMLEL